LLKEKFKDLECSCSPTVANENFSLKEQVKLLTKQVSDLNEENRSHIKIIEILSNGQKN